MDFGYTNEDDRYESALKWKNDAISDGWIISATYENESIDRCCRLKKDGFVVNIVSRNSNVGKWKYQASISIWGPDGLSIKPPYTYDADKILKGPRHCNYCDKDDVDTKRVSFAGRCCNKCYPSVVKKVEYEGWNN